MNTVNLEKWILENQTVVFYLLLMLSFLLNRLPYIGAFFRIVNTMLHKSGHAIGAFFTSGEVVRIDLNRDTSGIAQTKSPGRFGAFFTSFTGYPFAAAISSLLLVMTIQGESRLVAFILLSLALINLIFFVRNAFGMIWLVLFSALLFASVWYLDDIFLRLLMTFICLITFSESLASTLIISYIGLLKPKRSGDMANMQKSTGVPAAIWTLINLFIVSWLLFYTVMNYFPKLNSLPLLKNISSQL
ncbi:MAG TPA: M50 family metallopeptidase [Lentimicrobium sp.]|nr:M50 family metallopeptidase [Lentimicrobium sp.]